MTTMAVIEFRPSKQRFGEMRFRGLKSKCYFLFQSLDIEIKYLASMLSALQCTSMTIFKTFSNTDLQSK
ncbi:unnamed protein product [Rotaria socialis]|uniref:Uncharacterized protein n=1 Tax=Rotaria socialis TaxID=392032 RepID=A0A818EZ97_9BILA|nr:unnamed protein product [Rotaria socialis]